MTLDNRKFKPGIHFSNLIVKQIEHPRLSQEQFQTQQAIGSRLSSQQLGNFILSTDVQHQIDKIQEFQNFQNIIKAKRNDKRKNAVQAVKTTVNEIISIGSLKPTHQSVKGRSTLLQHDDSGQDTHQDLKELKEQKANPNLQAISVLENQSSSVAAPTSNLQQPTVSQVPPSQMGKSSKLTAMVQNSSHNTRLQFQAPDDSSFMGQRAHQYTVPTCQVGGQGVSPNQSELFQLAMSPSYANIKSGKNFSQQPKIPTIQDQSKPSDQGLTVVLQKSEAKKDSSVAPATVMSPSKSHTTLSNASKGFFPRAGNEEDTGFLVSIQHSKAKQKERSYFGGRKRSSNLPQSHLERIKKDYATGTAGTPYLQQKSRLGGRGGPMSSSGQQDFSLMSQRDLEIISKLTKAQFGSIGKQSGGKLTQPVTILGGPNWRNTQPVSSFDSNAPISIQNQDLEHLRSSLPSTQSPVLQNQSSFDRDLLAHINQVEMLEKDMLILEQEESLEQSKCASKLFTKAAVMGSGSKENNKGSQAAMETPTMFHQHSSIWEQNKIIEPVIQDCKYPKQESALSQNLDLKNLKRESDNETQYKQSSKPSPNTATRKRAQAKSGVAVPTQSSPLSKKVNYGVESPQQQTSKFFSNFDQLRSDKNSGKNSPLKNERILKLSTKREYSRYSSLNNEITSRLQRNTHERADQKSWHQYTRKDPISRGPPHKINSSQLDISNVVERQASSPNSNDLSISQNRNIVLNSQNKNIQTQLREYNRSKGESSAKNKATSFSPSNQSPPNQVSGINSATAKNQHVLKIDQIINHPEGEGSAAPRKETTSYAESSTLNPDMKVFRVRDSQQNKFSTLYSNAVKDSNDYEDTAAVISGGRVRLIKQAKKKDKSQFTTLGMVEKQSVKSSERAPLAPNQASANQMIFSCITQKSIPKPIAFGQPLNTNSGLDHNLVQTSLPARQIMSQQQAERSHKQLISQTVPSNRGINLQSNSSIQKESNSGYYQGIQQSPGQYQCLSQRLLRKYNQITRNVTLEEFRKGKNDNNLLNKFKSKLINSQQNYYRYVPTSEIGGAEIQVTTPLQSDGQRRADNLSSQSPPGTAEVEEQGVKMPRQAGRQGIVKRQERYQKYEQNQMRKEMNRMKRAQLTQIRCMQRRLVQTKNQQIRYKSTSNQFFEDPKICEPLSQVVSPLGLLSSEDISNQLAKDGLARQIDTVVQEVPQRTMGSQVKKYEGTIGGEPKVRTKVFKPSLFPLQSTRQLASRNKNTKRKLGVDSTQHMTEEAKPQRTRIPVHTKHGSFHGRLRHFVHHSDYQVAGTGIAGRTGAWQPTPAADQASQQSMPQSGATDYSHLNVGQFNRDDYIIELRADYTRPEYLPKEFQISNVQKFKREPSVGSGQGTIEAHGQDPGMETADSKTPNNVLQLVAQSSSAVKKPLGKSSSKYSTDRPLNIQNIIQTAQQEQTEHQVTSPTAVAAGATTAGGATAKKSNNNMGTSTDEKAIPENTEESQFNHLLSPGTLYEPVLGYSYGKSPYQKHKRHIDHEIFLC